LQLLGPLGGRREPVVQVDAKQQTVLLGRGDHFPGLFDVVGDRLLDQYVLACGE
jgi:hypothetical protein